MVATSTFSKALWAIAVGIVLLTAQAASATSEPDSSVSAVSGPKAKPAPQCPAPAPQHTSLQTTRNPAASPQQPTADTSDYGSPKTHLDSSNAGEQTNDTDDANRSAGTSGTWVNDGLKMSTKTQQCRPGEDKDAQVSQCRPENDSRSTGRCIDDGSHK